MLKNLIESRQNENNLYRSLITRDIYDFLTLNQNGIK